jgi:hypothetical protein
MDKDTMVTVYRYGLRAPPDWDETCEEQVLRQVALWNRLVSIEGEHRAAVRSISGSDQEVGELKRQFDALTNDIEAAIDERAARRVKTKSKAFTADLDKEITQLRLRRREIAGALKLATERTYKRDWERLRALEETRRGAVKRARQEAAGAGLWWGHYNAVVTAYQTARQRAIREGRCLYPRHPSGRARLVNQIIGGMSVEEFESGAHPQVRLGPQSGGHRDNPRFRTLIATVYSRGKRGNNFERRVVTWPVFLDRPLPPQARIQQVEILREYRSHCWHWHASILLRVPAPKERMTGSRVTSDGAWSLAPCASGPCSG